MNQSVPKPSPSLFKKSAPEPSFLGRPIYIDIDGVPEKAKALYFERFLNREPVDDSALPIPRYPHGFEIMDQYKRSFRHLDPEPTRSGMPCSFLLSTLGGPLDETLEASIARPVTDCPLCFAD